MTFLFSAIAALLATAAIYVFSPITFTPLCILVWLGFFVVIVIVVVLPPAIAGLFVDMEKPRKKWSVFWIIYKNIYIDFVFTIFRMRCKIEGKEKLPKERFLFVSNHRSSLDPMVPMLYLSKYKIGFVAKEELFKVPVISRLMFTNFCFCLRRGSPRDEIKTLRGASDRVKAGTCSIGIYPEGQRNFGESLLPFKSGAFKIAVWAACPIVISTIEGSGEVTKNTPKRSTRVTVKIVDVIPVEYVKTHTTIEIADEARRILNIHLGLPEYDGIDVVEAKPE